MAKISEICVRVYIYFAISYIYIYIYIELYFNWRLNNIHTDLVIKCEKEIPN